MPTVAMVEVKRDTMSAKAMTRTSSCTTWLISCASTPASSRADRRVASASVMAIAASPRRPTAKAFIIFDGTMKSFGAAGSPARRAISSTMRTPVGNSASSTGRALYIASTMRGLARCASHSDSVPNTAA